VPALHLMCAHLMCAHMPCSYVCTHALLLCLHTCLTPYVCTQKQTHVLQNWEALTLCRRAAPFDV